LIAIAHTNEEGRRVRLIERRAAMRLPPLGAGPLVERDDERRVAAVAAEDQQVFL